MRRRLLLLCAFLCLTAGWAWTGSSQPRPHTIVARYDGEAITLGTFETAYAHDVGGWATARSDAHTAYASFLSTYLDYRLKVHAARAAGYGRAPDVKIQQRAYRLQMTHHHLRIDSVLTPIMHTLRDPLPPTEDARDALQQHVERLPQTRTAEQAFWRRTRIRHGVRIDTLRLLHLLGTDGLDADPASLLPQHAESTASFGINNDTAFTLAELSAFWQSTPRLHDRPLGDVLDAYLHDLVLARAASDRMASNPSFRHQLQRHHDGLLLFALMQDSVWTPALRDTAEQRAYFDRHRARYQSMPGDSTDALAASAGAGAQVFHGMRGRPEQETSSLISFEDVRRAVVRDFQTHRERQFVRRLRNRYRARLYPQHLHAAFQRVPDAQ